MSKCSETPQIFINTKAGTEEEEEDSKTRCQFNFEQTAGSLQSLSRFLSLWDVDADRLYSALSL